ncbi:Nucleic acid-binding protein [Corchorus capsularis]|uniref:Nucleic acid-binding protein n=1 Tax=Corchorus capsularis TaxID=210143 RepID=A0A1R3J1W2_COCAP|nr:Nucleic acid-binding protein [Corchorus capsularis]
MQNVRRSFSLFYNYQGFKFKVNVVVKGIDQSAVWYYAACDLCGQALTETFEVFYCTQHQIQTPQFMPKIPLLINDHTARMRVMIFGDHARDMTEELAMCTPEKSRDNIASEGSEAAQAETPPTLEKRNSTTDLDILAVEHEGNKTSTRSMTKKVKQRLSNAYCSVDFARRQTHP